MIRLRHERKSRGISQETLAVISGIPALYILQIENRRLNPTIQELDALRVALGLAIPARDLLTVMPDPPKSEFIQQQEVMR